MQILENVKKELTENTRLMTDFPEVFETYGKPKPPRWTQYEIETRNQIKVLALGSGQRIRGRKYGNYRPTLVIADDIENTDNTFTTESREKIKEWFNKSILKVGAEETNFLFIGTLYHPHCLLGEYLNPEANPVWIKKIYKAIMLGPKHSELWERWSNTYNNKEAFEGLKGPEAAQKFYETNREKMDEGIELLWSEKWDYYKLMVTPISTAAD